MKDREVSLGALQRAIEARAAISDQDVSNHPDVTRAHQRFLAEFNYHAAIGKALSNNRQALGVELVSTAGGNARWAKAAARPQAQAAEPVGSVMLASDIGPQFRGDSPFTARMRLHQSWYRATVLGVPCGTGPLPSSQTHYGNMLDEAAGDAGLNFLTPQIFSVARCAHRARRGRRAVPVPAQHAQQPADVLQPVRSARR